MGERDGWSVRPDEKHLAVCAAEPSVPCYGEDERENERVGTICSGEKHLGIRCRRASRRLPAAENREGKRWAKNISPSALPSLRFPAMEEDERENEMVGALCPE